MCDLVWVVKTSPGRLVGLRLGCCVKTKGCDIPRDLKLQIVSSDALEAGEGDKADREGPYKSCKVVVDNF